jgi:hypothetical protein
MSTIESLRPPHLAGSPRCIVYILIMVMMSGTHEAYGAGQLPLATDTKPCHLRLSGRATESVVNMPRPWSCSEPREHTGVTASQARTTGVATSAQGDYLQPTSHGKVA